MTRLNILLRLKIKMSGIVKSVRKPPVRLIIAPFPDHQKNSEEFFFQPSSQNLLTTAIQA